ncbi:MAG: hypothetical protein HY279_02340 [Nitrospinae bacterium]|nr:hypothetical protein [Nitrospinota bacterium]
MFLPETPTGVIDLTIFKEIAEYNQNAIFLFMKPNIMGGSFDRSVLDKRLIRSIRQGLIFGLLIEDSDDNIFLFLKKNKDIFFEPEQIKDMLREIASKGNKYFEIDDMRISLKLYENIKNGSNEIKEMKSFLFRRKSTEIRLFIMRIINSILSHPAMINDYDTYRRIKDIVEQKDYKELKLLVDKLIPQFAEILKNEVLKN